MVSVIVCTYNRQERLKCALQSLSQLKAPANNSWEFIIVDNNSNDLTAQTVKDFASHCLVPTRYIFEPQQGLSHARNAGIAASAGDVLAFTDDDVTLDPGWICELQQTFDSFACAAVGGKIIPTWTCPKPSWLLSTDPDLFRRGAIVCFDPGDEVHEIATAFGANMAFRKEVFQRYGSFRTDLGKCGNDAMTGEDTEFCARLSCAGNRIVYAPNAVVYHPVPETGLKRQFKTHYLQYGRYTVRLDGLPSQAILWFGVPRYMFRHLFVDIYGWLRCMDANRFLHKLKVYESLGAVAEARRIFRLKQVTVSSATTMHQLSD